MIKVFSATNNRLPLLIPLMLVLLVTTAGCGRAPSKQNKQEVDATPYLGTWKCVGIRDGEGTRSLEEYVTATGEFYSAAMVVRGNGFAYILEHKGDIVDSTVIPWLRQDYKVIGDEERHKEVPKGPLYSTGVFELDGGQLLKSFTDGKKLVFSKESDSLDPLLRSVPLPGCTIDIPIELMDDYEWQIDNLGGVEKMSARNDMGLKGEKFEGRDPTSARIYVRRSSKGGDDHPDGEEVVVNGSTLYLTSENTVDAQVRKVVQFVLPSQESVGYDLYEISLYYDEGEAPYYENYANSFTEKIRIGNDIMPDAETIADSSESPTSVGSGYVEGVISWREAPQHVGEHVELAGIVAEANYSPGSSGQPTFIDLGEAYPSPNRVTVVIWGENRGNFPGAPEDIYAGKYVKVEGLLYQHDGIYNIEVSSPSQIDAR